MVIYETLAEDPNKTLVVSFDANANLVELIFHAVGDQDVVVFHAMSCRKVFLNRILK